MSTPENEALSQLNPPQQAQHSRVNKLIIQPLLGQAKRIRNVCILAHVDHGKHLIHK